MRLWYARNDRAQLAAKLRQQRADIAILFVTGYADIESVEAVLGGGQTILRKPYHFDALVSAVAQALTSFRP